MGDIKVFFHDILAFAISNMLVGGGWYFSKLDKPVAGLIVVHYAQIERKGRMLDPHWVVDN